MQRFHHEQCGNDIFIGEAGQYDVWICTRNPDPEMRTVMLRFGNDPAEYLSRWYGICTLDPYEPSAFGIARAMIDARNEPLTHLQKGTADHVHLHPNS